MLKVLAALAIAPFTFALTAGLTHDDAPRCRVIVTTFDGMNYIAGEGDDERAAYEGIVVPDNWQEIYTECNDQ